MSHEITGNDWLVLAGQRAWHGLGVVVENAPTPADALQIAKLDWTVEQWALSATDGARRVACQGHLANVRADTSAVLGIVGEGYKPIQNAELADFCSLLAEQGDVVKLESAGSIRGGQKVWMLIRGESFSVRTARGDDVLAPYICVSNGHDGGTALRCTPTSVRVVCSNTLHMVIPADDPMERRSGLPKLRLGTYVARHTGNIRAKVEEAKAALGLYGRTLAATRDVIDLLAVRDVNSEQVSRFLLRAYVETIGAVPTNPTTEQEQRRHDNAQKALRDMLGRFDVETQHFGGSMWTALNAYTAWAQHEYGRNPRNIEAARERRIHSALFGAAADRSTTALAVAMATAV